MFCLSFPEHFPPQHIISSSSSSSSPFNHFLPSLAMIFFILYFIFIFLSDFISMEVFCIDADADSSCKCFPCKCSNKEIFVKEEKLEKGKGNLATVATEATEATDATEIIHIRPTTKTIIFHVEK